MPNLDLHLRMKEVYGYSPIEEQKDYFQKGLDSRALAHFEGDETSYFVDGKEVNVSLLFIDICSFSTRMKDLSGSETAIYFSQYYDIIFPIIFKYNGVIERVIGDGIVALFGPPFTKLWPAKVISEVDLCAKEILLHTNGTRFSSKIAFHSGIVRYFKNQSGYEDYTIIGRAITELFRLESIAMDQAINYFDRSVIKIFYDEVGVNNWPTGIRRTGRFTEYHQPIMPPKGTDYKGLCYIENHN